MKLEALKSCKDDLEKERFFKELKKTSCFFDKENIDILLDHLETPNITLHKYVADVLAQSYTSVDVLLPYLPQLADKTFLFRYPFFLLYLRSLVENNCSREEHIFRLEFFHFENSIVENYLHFLHGRIWNPQFLKNATEIILDNNAHYFWQSPYDYLYKLENDKFLAENHAKLDLRLAPDKTKIFAILFSIMKYQFSRKHYDTIELLEAFLKSSKESLVEYGLWKILVLNIKDHDLFAHLYTIPFSQLSPLISLVKFSQNSAQADFISLIPQITQTKFALAFLHIALYHQIPINYSFFCLHSQIQLENYTMWCNSKVIFDSEEDEIKHVDHLLMSTKKNDLIVALYRMKTFYPAYNEIIVKQLLKLNDDQKINTLLLSIIESNSHVIEDSVWQALQDFCTKTEDPDVLLYAITILLKKYSLEAFPILKKMCSQKLSDELIDIFLEYLAKLMENEEWCSFCNEIEASLLDNIFSFADDDLFLFFIQKIGMSPFEVALENATLFQRLERSQNHEILHGVIWFLHQKDIFNVQIKQWLFSLLERHELDVGICISIFRILITTKPYISSAHFDLLIHFRSANLILMQARRQTLDAVRLDFPEIINHLKNNNCIVPELESKIKKFSATQIARLIEQASHLSEELSITLYQQTPLEYLWQQKDYFLSIVTKQNFIANYTRKILIRMCIETTSDSVLYQQTRKAYESLINNYSPDWQTQDLENYIYPFFANIEQDEPQKNAKQVTTDPDCDSEPKKGSLHLYTSPKYKYENIKPQTADLIIHEQKNLPEFLYEHAFNGLQNIDLSPLKMKRLWTIRECYLNVINEKEVIITQGYIYEKKIVFYLCEFLYGADNQTINFVIEEFSGREEYLFIKMNWCTEEYKTYKYLKQFTPEETNIFFIESRQNIFNHILQNNPSMPLFPDHNSIIYYLITPQVYNFELQIHSGDLKRIKRIRTPRSITLGKGSPSQVIIPNDKELCLQHCIFEFTISYIKVRKLDENAQIFINDKQIDEAIVEPGDKIVLGNNTILYLGISFLWPKIVATCSECGSDLKLGESYCPKCSAPPLERGFGFRRSKTKEQTPISTQNLFERIKPPKQLSLDDSPYSPTIQASPSRLGRSSGDDLYGATIQMGGSPLKKPSTSEDSIFRSNIFGRGATQKPIAAAEAPPPPPKPKKAAFKGKKKAVEDFKKVAREKVDTTEKQISYPEPEDVTVVKPKEQITRSGQRITRRPPWFEMWLSGDAGRPGPLERIVSKSITAMKVMQKTIGVYFVIVAHTFDSISELITTYIRNFFEIWKTYHTIKKRLKIKDSKQQIHELYNDLEKSRLYLSRIFHFSGFAPYLYKNQDYSSTFPLKIIIEVRGHLDQMKRDLVFVNAQEIQENVKKNIIDNLKNLIPNPIEWITPFKDIFIMTLYMKYKRPEIEHIYSEFLHSYNTLLVELSKQNNIEEQTVKKYFWQLHPYEEQLALTFPNQEIVGVNEAIEKSRYYTQCLIQLLCNCNYLINYSKWSKTDLLREVVSMKQQDAYYPGPIIELEKWIYHTGKKIFTKHHKDKINPIKDKQELLDLKKREQLAKILHYHFY